MRDQRKLTKPLKLAKEMPDRRHYLRYRGSSRTANVKVAEKTIVMKQLSNYELISSHDFAQISSNFKQIRPEKLQLNHD